MSMSALLHDPISARTQHHHHSAACPAYAALQIQSSDGEITIFGPASAMDAFSQAAAIINAALAPARQVQCEAAE